MLAACISCSCTTSVHRIVTEKKTQPTRMGVSECATWFGIWSTGDASIERATQNGGITAVRFTIQDTCNYLGIYKQYTTAVWGD